MPSGKILSFLHGEISPALRYATNLISYATGLRSLYNKTVRKAGGCSNKPGFQYVKNVNYQDDLEIPGAVRIFGINLALKDNEATTRDSVFVVPSAIGASPEMVADGIYDLDANVTVRDLTNVKLSQVGSKAILSNGSTYWAYELSDEILTGLYKDQILIAPIAINSTVPAATVAGSFGVGFVKPVHYRVYQVLRNGEEIFFASYTGNNAVEPVLLSSGQLYTTLDVSLSSDPEVKHYNVYRSAVAIGVSTRGPWGLVGRIQKPAVDGVNRFHDYLVQPDFLSPPPDEDYLYGNAAFPKQVTSARLVGHYQQRRVIVAEPSNSQLEEGSVVCSKIGVPDELDTSVIFKPTGAFDFKTPIGVKNRIVAMLELERLILLTEDAVVIVRGGDNGVLAPQSVNPHVITYDGCSSKVTPVAASSYGFFMSKNDQKLMRIFFVEDGNVGVKEESVLADHLIENDKVVEMALTKGKEDILWLLKDSGKLVSITLHQGGEATGWARHDTDGFIESITSQTINRQEPINYREDSETYDSLYICVVRDVNGTRTRMLERLAFREDREDRKQQWFYADSFMTFGSRLALNQNKNRYRKFVAIDDSDTEFPDHKARTGTPIRAFYYGTPAGAGSVVVVQANFSGTIGNAITLTGNGADDVDTLVGAWNAANPDNTATVVAGGTETPNNTIDFSPTGGSGQWVKEISTLLNITGGVNWDENEDLTVTFLGGGGNFQDPAVEKQVIDFYYENADGVVTSIRWEQNGFTSAQIATGRFQGTVPTVLRDVEGQALTATEKTLRQSRWTRVKNQITGLTHLAGREVSVFANEVVVSSPNNPRQDTLTVDAGGVLELGAYYAWGYVGIPYESEMETLDLDASDNRTLTDARKLINRLGIAFHETKGGFFGGKNAVELKDFEELTTRVNQSIEEEDPNANEHFVLNIPNEWEKTGRVKIKQVDPLPMTVLAVYPKGIAGD